MSLKRISLLVTGIAVACVMTACTTSAPDKLPSSTPPILIPPVATPPVVTPPVVTPPVAPKPGLPSASLPAQPVNVLRPTTYATVPGWGSDDLRAAWPAFLVSCEVMIKRAGWERPCNMARNVDAKNNVAIRTFFEVFFVPHQVINQDGTDTGLVTGYYEPLLRGARTRGGRYQVPLHRVPDDLLALDLTSVYPDLKGMRLRGRLVGNKIMPYFSRAEMMQAATLTGKELLWVDDAIEAFFLQVQGSGRVQLDDTKEIVRVAYAEQNGHPYRSIGRYLVEKGEMTLDQASAQSIKAWYAANPARQQELLSANPSYVFFKEEKIVDPSKGPKGAMGVPLTPQRSIAIDPQFIPLGAPVFLATTQPNSNVPLQQLMLAQDTGGAIRNPVRADFFWGFGADAGEKAGRMKQRGTMWVLLPKPQ